MGRSVDRRRFNASLKMLLRLPDVKPPIVDVSEQSAVVFISSDSLR